VVATIKIVSFGMVSTLMNVCCVYENNFSYYIAVNNVECMAHLFSGFQVFIAEHIELEISKKCRQAELSIQLMCIMILLFHVKGGLDSTSSHSNGAGGP